MNAENKITVEQFREWLEKCIEANWNKHYIDGLKAALAKASQIAEPTEEEKYGESICKPTPYPNPTVNDMAGLKASLQKWCDNDVCSCRYDIERIMDEYPTAPTCHPVKQEEPLAVESFDELMNRKGKTMPMFEFYRLGKPRPFWCIRLADINFPENWREYREGTREETLLSARQYLNGIPDKEGR